jgi:hypothetical protein
MPKPSKAADLLRVLGGQKTPTDTPADKTVAAPEPTTPGKAERQTAPPSPKKGVRPSHAPASRPPKAIRGKAIQFYLHEGDEKLIREFAAWLAPHRKRINDSLVVKAVLRAAKTGPALLAAYDEAVAIDGRTKVHKKGRQQEP